MSHLRAFRTRLAFVYGGLFVAAGMVVLTIQNLFGETNVRPVGQQAPGTAVPDTTLGLGELYSGVALAVLTAFSLGLGWLIAGRVVTRLGASFESQRHFVANASHELRTPLAAERTLLQVTLANPHATTETLRATCEQLLALNHRQGRLIEALLTLATGEGGTERRERFDLADLTDDVVRGHRPEADRRGIQVQTMLTPAPVTGDPGLVRSFVTNLVDNALRHNLADGRMEISVTGRAGQATITVSNTGHPIPPDDVNRLFQPFQRLGNRRTQHTDGHGLGLAIVHAIATTHHAKITASPRPDGGLHITATFPR
jgi:signal transduction histidine kinase